MTHDEPARLTVTVKARPMRLTVKVNRVTVTVSAQEKMLLDCDSELYKSHPTRKPRCLVKLIILTDSHGDEEGPCDSA
jgi:methyl coenzyme M reductase subunit D